MFTRLNAAAALAILLFLTVSACTPLARPELHLADLRFGEMRAFETELLIGVRIENEEREVLHTEGGTYRLYINDVYLGKGMTSEPLTVPAHSSATQWVTIQVRNLAVIPMIRKMMESSDFNYRIEGRLSRRGWAPDVRASDEGRFSMSDFSGQL